MTPVVSALEVDELWVRVGANPIIRGISLCVERSTTVALIGPNGAGKTTTLRAVMGLLPARGDIRLAGESVQRCAAHERVRRGLGYAPEDRRLIAALTVEDNLWLPIRAVRLTRAEGQRRFERVLALLPELKVLLLRWAATLSGGQQKIVALARALMAARSLLLLDEPFQGLAPPLARRYAQALAQLRDDDAHIAILIAESNPTLLRPLVQKTYAIERGELVDAAANKSVTAGRAPT